MAEKLIFSKDISLEEQEKVRKYLKKLRAPYLEPLSGEEPKTDEQGQLVDRTLELYRNMETGLGLELPSLETSNFHFLTREQFSKYSNLETAIGYYLNNFNTILLNKEHQWFNQGFHIALHLIFHEAVHFAGYQSRLVKLANNRSQIFEYRSGYTLRNPIQNLFLGFNEGVVEQIALGQLLKDPDLGSHYEAICADPQKLTYLTPQPYLDTIQIIRAVWEEVAKMKDIPSEEAWGKVRSGHFTGEMMHLRDVETAFGEGSLRKLAAIKQVPADISDDTNTQILRYFQRV